MKKKAYARLAMFASICRLRLVLLFAFALVSNFAQANAAGSPRTVLDPAFKPQLTRTMADVSFSAVASLPDGKTLAAGNFEVVDGLLRPHLVRLNRDGTVDRTFNAGELIERYPINRLVPLRNGKTLLSGGFQFIQGKHALTNAIVRLNEDGTLDPAFELKVSFFREDWFRGGITGTLLGVLNNGNIVAHLTWGFSETLALDSTGKFLHLLDVDRAAVPTFVREEADGAFVLGTASGLVRFPPGSRFGTPVPGAPSPETVSSNLPPLAHTPRFEQVGRVSAAARDRSGRIILGGLFDFVDNVECPNPVRLLADGTVDRGFKVPFLRNTRFEKIGVLSDGRIVISGSSGFVKPVLLCLNADGSLDEPFNERMAACLVSASAAGPVFAVAPDDTIRVSVAEGACWPGSNRPVTALINRNGTFDPNFNPAGLQAFELLVQNDGKTIVSGDFFRTNSDGSYAYQNAFLRLSVSGEIDSSFKPELTGLRLNSVLSDGSILARSEQKLVRLSPDGTLAAEIMPPAVTVEDEIVAAAADPHGRILLAKRHTEAKLHRYPDWWHSTLFRLQPDGSTDTSLPPVIVSGANFQGDPYVTTLLLPGQRDLIVAGSFNFIDGQPRFAVARFTDLPVIAIERVEHISLEELRLTFGANVGQIYAVERSEDLQTWTQALTQIAATTHIEVQIPVVAPSKAFYRVRTQ